MSNSVGKAREHERWQKRQEEEKHRAKLVAKYESDEELSQRILGLLNRNPIQEEVLGDLLRLSRVDSLRLKDILLSLAKAGKVRVTTEEHKRILSLT